MVNPLLKSIAASDDGMTLYLKAAADKVSLGDCPFAHFVRMVLEEKGLTYEIRPAVHETKPEWLLDFYDGKMPALRVGNKCYVESDLIAEYLDSNFPEPPLHVEMGLMDKAETVASMLFPPLAKYLKHTPDGDSDDLQLKSQLEETLAKIDAHFQSVGADGPFLTGASITLLDCSLTPKLYHMMAGLEAFKSNAIDVSESYPHLHRYYQFMFSRDSFRRTAPGKEVIAWGWGNARSS